MKNTVNDTVNATGICQLIRLRKRRYRPPSIRRITEYSPIAPLPLKIRLSAKGSGSQSRRETLTASYWYQIVPDVMIAGKNTVMNSLPTSAGLKRLRPSPPANSFPNKTAIAPPNATI